MQRALAARFLMLALFLSVAGCGGGSPTSSGPTGARFIAAPAAGGNAIVLSSPLMLSTLLIIEVQVVEVENLHFATFDLAFPAHILSLNGVSEGGYLSGSGEDEVAFAFSEAEGVVSVDVRRLAEPRARSGSGRLATIGFRVIGEGSGDLDFRFARATDASHAEIPGLVWLGGRVENHF